MTRLVALVIITAYVYTEVPLKMKLCRALASEVILECNNTKQCLLTAKYINTLPTSVWRVSGARFKKLSKDTFVWNVILSLQFVMNNVHILKWALGCSLQNKTIYKTKNGVCRSQTMF